MTTAPRITGATRLYGIIGDPIVQVRSPEVYTARFAEAGLDAVMVPILIPADKFDVVAPALLALGNLDVLLEIIDRAPTRSASLIGRLHPLFPKLRLEPAAAMSAEADMIVNATTVGMQPDDPMPAPIGPLRRDTLVGDVVISASPTAFIRHAIACGCRWVDGKDTHSGQIEAIMSFFGLTNRASDSPTQAARQQRRSASPTILQ